MTSRPKHINDLSGQKKDKTFSQVADTARQTVEPLLVQEWYDFYARDH